MKTIKLLTIVLSTALLFGACQKPDIINEDVETPETVISEMNDLQVDKDFNWKTTKDIQVTVEGNMAGAVFIKGADGNVYQKAMLAAGTSYSTKITVPSYMDEVILASNGQSKAVTIENSSVQYTFN